MSPDSSQPKTNSEIRQWYLQRLALIPELNKYWIEQGLTARERAQEAWRIRHSARIEARSMMADPDEVDLLGARDMIKYGSAEGPSFEFLVERLRRLGVREEMAYELIVDNSHRTDAELNRKLGL